MGNGIVNSNADNIVFICAHQDDITSVAGTLLRLKERYKLHDFCLTLGQKGKLPESGRDTAEVRCEEEAEVCRLLNADLQFFDQMDGELFAGQGICEWVAAELGKLKPAAVITLWPLEKPDHAAAAQIALRALTIADLYFTTEIYLRVSHEAISRMASPELYVNISDVIEEKIAVARCYKSQWGEKQFEYIREFAAFLGRMAWCDYAEAYKTALPMIDQRWGRPTEVGRILLDLGPGKREVPTRGGRRNCGKQ
jgi:LmbE family N-acetylglucosaminyl deacetylase